MLTVLLLGEKKKMKLVSQGFLFESKVMWVFTALQLYTYVGGLHR